jgi:hypothetical protein
MLSAALVWGAEAMGEGSGNSGSSGDSGRSEDIGSSGDSASRGGVGMGTQESRGGKGDSGSRGSKASTGASGRGRESWGGEKSLASGFFTLICIAGLLGVIFISKPVSIPIPVPVPDIHTGADTHAEAEH